ncbi:MAG: DUF853 family protein [Candidatus Aenigmarchaeota archaeon]|nr:DUF853 family protein [Candidatus Aenigmarchaeota archaeon]
MPVSVYLGESNEGSVSWIPKNEKNPHLLVVGTSGSGKTVTLRSLVYELGKSGIPSLIVDFHNDFDDLAESILDFKNITINPLDFSGGETAETSMYKVSSILSKIFRLGVQQEGVLQDAIIESYGKYGIGLKDTMHDGAIPDFNTVRRALEEKIDVLREERRATVTVETLMVRLRPLFDTGFFSQKETKKFDEIFMKTTVLKLRDLPTDEVKYTVAEFFLNKLKYALYKKGKTDELRLYCIVDEAHRLIDERSPLNDLLRESRKYGTGVIMSSQRPGDFSETVLANIGAFIAFQCRLDKDSKFVSKQMKIDFESVQNLTETGTAYIDFSSSDRSLKVKVKDYDSRTSGKKQIKNMRIEDTAKTSSDEIKIYPEKKYQTVKSIPNKKSKTSESLHENPENYSAKIITHEKTRTPLHWFFDGIKKSWDDLGLILSSKIWRAMLIAAIVALGFFAFNWFSILAIIIFFMVLGFRKV